MKILVLSDIHDNLPNLKKCLALAAKKKIETIICCGDVTNSETLKFVSENFAGDIYLVRGNMEIYNEVETDLYKNIKYLGRFGLTFIDNKNIGLCHEPDYISDVISLSKSRGETGCDMIFYGHTHRPWEGVSESIRTVNPGTVAGTFSRATCAIWDTNSNQIELKLLETI